MKVVVFVAHPDLSESRMNKALIAAIKGDSDITVVEMDKNYNIQEHQKLMLENDRIVLQFPVFWFNLTALGKKWMDDVLAYGWAYGSASKLENKEFMICATTGQSNEAYTREGELRHTIDDLFLSLQMSAMYCKMKYLPYFHIGNRHAIKDSELQEAGKQYLQHIKKSY